METLWEFVKWVCLMVWCAVSFFALMLTVTIVLEWWYR